MKNILFKLKRWFLEHFVYSSLAHENIELIQLISTKSGAKNLRTKFYLVDKSSPKPYLLVVCMGRKRMFEQWCDNLNLSNISDAAALQVYLLTTKKIT